VSDSICLVSLLVGKLLCFLWIDASSDSAKLLERLLSTEVADISTQEGSMEELRKENEMVKMENQALKKENEELKKQMEIQAQHIKTFEALQAGRQ